MTFPITPLNGSRANDSGSSFDLSKFAVDPKKTAFRGSASGTTRSSTPVRTATRPIRVGLNPDEVKRLTTAFLPVAQKLVDTTFAPYITLPPKLQLKFWTPEQRTAANINKDYNALFGYVDSAAPGTINVAYKSAVFKHLNAKDTKALLLHEVLHTRSKAFTVNIARTYGEPLANGKPASFSDGSPVFGIVEGLTEIFTKIALKVGSTPPGYELETKWAAKLVEKVGIETAKKAYFGSDALSVVKVENAIEELVAADKKSPEIPAARSN